MKKLLNFAMYVSLSVTIVLFLGMLIPVLISTFIVLTTSTTMEECVVSITFWLFCLIGWFWASIFLKECVNYTS